MNGELHLTNDISELKLLREYLGCALKDIPMKSDAKSKLRAAVDEAVTNAVRYAYDTPGGPIDLKTDTSPFSITFTLRDSGRPFNPLEYNPPEDESLIEMNLLGVCIGGMGIPLIRKVFDELSYERKNGENIFVMTKNYTAQTA